MVQILPKVPGFGERLGAAIGGGLGGGFQQGIEKAMEKNRLSELLGLGKKGQQQAPGAGESPSQDFSNLSTQQRMAIASEFPEASKVIEADIKQHRKESFTREQAGESKLEEIGDKLDSYEQSGLRFDRLNNLFSPALDEKFPPALMAGAFTKDGELRPTAQASLSPEAQEAVKLVTDEIRGAKDTFGARVTNFDASTYLKTLPGLLNTAEGRRKVLRDLRIMNQLNQQQANGILDVVDRYGGPSKISISKAKQIYKKENIRSIEELRKAFKYPEEFPFTELTDFNASLYPGVTIEDPETDQTFTSNGRTWENA